MTNVKRMTNELMTTAGPRQYGCRWGASSSFPQGLAVDLIHMSETVLTIEDAARTLAEVVERVHSRGEPALLVKSGKPIARIVPFRPARKLPKT